MATVTTATNRYLSAFEAFERQGALASPAWLASLRRSAIERFGEDGFPPTRAGNGRSANLAPLAAVPFRPAGGRALAELPSAALPPALDPDWPRLVFVDGRYSARHSSPRPLPDGARLSTLVETMTRD